MARKRFRWTRRKYRAASTLARFMGRHLCELPGNPPALLQRYMELWDRHPQREDPLTRPHWQRYPGDSIPF